MNGSEDITQSLIVNRLLEGINRSKPKIKDARLPITRDMLKGILASLPLVCRSIYEPNLFQAAFSIAFHGLLRIGELVVNNGDVRHIVSVSDVTFERCHLGIHLPSSKTDQLGIGSVIILDQQQDENICPCNLLKIDLKGRPSVQGPLFCHLDGKSLTRYQFVSILKKALNWAGISDKGFSSHSFRIGAATSLAMEGVPVSRIMQLDRCKYKACKGYIRI